MGSCKSVDKVVINELQITSQQGVDNRQHENQFSDMNKVANQSDNQEDLKDNTMQNGAERINRILYFNYEEKDIEKQELFSYINVLFFSDWQSDAQKHNIDLEINETEMNFQFSTKGNLDQEYFDNYINSVSKVLNQVRGYKLKCSSKVQSNLMQTLSQDQKFLACVKEEWKIDTFQAINPEQQKDEQHTLIFIVLFQELPSFSLKEIIQQLIIRETIKDSINFYGYSKQEIKITIKSLKKNNKYIEVQWQIKEECEKRKILIISYTTWKSIYNDQLGDILKLKSEVEQYFKPVEIELSEQNQIFIWNELVSAFYGAGNEKYLCTTKCLAANKLVIELKGISNTVLGIKQDIENNMKQFKIFHISLSFQSDKKLFEFFEKKQCSELFKKSLKQIEQQFSNCQVRMKIDNFKSAKNDGQGFMSGKVIFNEKQYSISEIQDVLQNSFLNSLEIYQISCQIPDLLKLLSLKDIIQFEEEYEVYVHRIDSEVFFIGLDQQNQQVKKFLNQIEQKAKEQQEQGTISLVSSVIKKQIQMLINEKQLILPNDAKVTYDRKLNMIIVCNKTLLSSLLNEIKNKVEELQNQIVFMDCKFTEQEMDLLLRKNICEVERIENEYNCQIQEVSREKIKEQKLLCLSQLNYMNKTLALIQDDIVNLKCDMIVNSCNSLLSFGNPDMLSGVAKSISLFAGNQYQVFCQNFIKQNSELLLGETLTYEMPPQSSIQYIINVVTPIYEYSDQIKNNFTCIQDNINAIFHEANQRGIKSLAIPLLGCGACGIAFKEATEVIVNEIINQFFDNSCKLQMIYIVELYEKRINDLQDILQQQLHVVNQREVKFQWQWLSDEKTYQDFDDLDINRQIDEAYEQFIIDNSKNQIQLKFSYSKQPGTHQVDLVNKQLIDLTVANVQSLTSETKQNNKRFSINGKEIDDTLNEYFILKEMLNELIFYIFLKEYRIIFNQNKDQFYQENIKTGYKRKIRHVELDPEKYLKNQNILIGKEFKLTHYLNRQQIYILDASPIDPEGQQSYMRIFSLWKQINLDVEQALQTALDHMIIQKEFLIPNLFIDDLEKLMYFIKRSAYKFDGKIEGLSKIQIQILKSQENEFMLELDHFLNPPTFYPKEWIKQDLNMIKVELKTTEPEYQKVQNLFKETDNGTIHRIYRIQNKSLWENYVQEKRKLLKCYQGTIQLTQNESERFLWHGVKNQHPQIIYEGEKEAFDPTYSNNACMWGNGIYFAEKAAYSRGYSFVLNGQQDPDLNGKKVFLCCLVTTGKLEQRSPDIAIKKPAKGYDCVTGFTNGSDVFILYTMDVRRAYPAYEVIYQ